MDGLMDGWMDGWMNGWIDWCMKYWMDQQTNIIHLFIYM